jgi:AGZA family xanthine/uracil permease-like MFS transporter
MAIVLWIGIVITAQGFQTTPPAHAPAVVVGLLPGVAAWGVLMAKSGLRAAGIGTPGHEPFSAALIPAFQIGDTWIDGGFALEQGFIFTSMLLAALTVAVIERQFTRAAAWASLGAVLSAVGLLHAYRFTPADTALALQPAWPWATGYALMAVLLAVAPWITVEDTGH